MVHTNGAVGDKLLPETMGSGCAFFDYDGDGDQDLLLVNSRVWSTPPEESPATTVLYQNDGRGRFDDVSKAAGINVSLYGMGVACGDYDNDGRVDVYLTALGANRLFRNVGDRFVDVTDTAGVAGEPEAWSTSAGFLDYDNDGDLDLFVCNYIVWSPELDFDINYTLNGTDRAYGPPTQYPATHCVLYRNEGSVRLSTFLPKPELLWLTPLRGSPKARPWR